MELDYQRRMQGWPVWTAWRQGIGGLARGRFWFFRGCGCVICVWLRLAFILLWININIPSTRTINRNPTPRVIKSIISGFGGTGVSIGDKCSQGLNKLIWHNKLFAKHG